MSLVFLGGPAVALAPVVASDTAVAGIFAVASVPADHVVPILAGIFTYFPHSCKIRHFRLSDYGYPTVFFLQSDDRNIEYRNDEFYKLSYYRVSNQGLNLSDSGNN